MIGRRCLVAILLLLVLLASYLPLSAQTEGAALPAEVLTSQDEGVVLVLPVTGVIDPLVAQYISRGIDTAIAEDAQVLVIEIDTPGGLDTSMREIVQKILNSPVPIAVYVAPSGARSASAGVFITLAGHIAAMSPSTNIGAAHPVSLGGEPTQATIEDKITNDAAAYIRSIAQARGKNADWAERAVRESISATEEEALQENVIDLIATSRADLLAQIDGREVNTNAGVRSLATANAQVIVLEMTLAERLLHALVDPNIAFLLLNIGILALIAEFYTPGAVIPGATGVICLILAFISLGSLPLNWGGIALLLLAILLFIIDIKVTGFALSVFGALAFVLGSLFLFSPFAPSPPSAPQISVNPWLIAAMTAGIVAFFLFVVSKGLAARRLPVVMGDTHRLIGAIGVATTDLSPEGTVLLQSEDWTAVAEEGRIASGEQVKVVGVEGLKIRVRRRSR